ncbi:MAG TPA: hypothetical protein VHZ55_12015 [Bryobacteraceae bacterium]|nr:hypothetical protein [Bryobacteraceae bacterium]
MNRSPLNLACLSFLFVAGPVAHGGPWAALWTTPCILVASVLITWGAESAQYFVAQGFALAILAWMQTLPEFAVEAVLAWQRQTPLLMANLTGALRLLTGLAWPMIYFTAALTHRHRVGQPLRRIKLDPHHSVEVVALLPPLLYALVIWWKASLHAYDAIVLVAIYAAYLLVLTKLPPEGKEDVGELAVVPRSIVAAPRRWRTASILACFLGGGALIYFTAEPFLGSIEAVSIVIGIPTFVVIQWFAPVVSEFPELASTFYFARQEDEASTAIMNIASSNINQWTLLVAMLPVVFSMSLGHVASFSLDEGQCSELLLTIAQSCAGLAFLMNMEVDWWEAACMFLLFVLQFVLPKFIGARAHDWITLAFLLWAAAEFTRILVRHRVPPAMRSFAETWRMHALESR